MRTKTCTRCHDTKPLDGFSRDGRAKDGREARCRTCKAEQSAEWRAKNPGRNAEKCAEYYVRNREQLTEYFTEYRKVNRARIAKRDAAYYAANPHVHWARTYRRRARKYGHPIVVEDFTKDDVIERYGDCCFHCGGPFEELDHYPLPVVHGGPHTLDGVKPSCTPCNRPGYVRRGRVA